jgi:hypothetical protein
MKHHRSSSVSRLTSHALNPVIANLMEGDGTCPKLCCGCADNLDPVTLRASSLKRSSVKVTPVSLCCRHGADRANRSVAQRASALRVDAKAKEPAIQVNGNMSDRVCTRHG